MSENNGNGQHTETVKGVTINSHQDLRVYVQKLTQEHQATTSTNTQRIQNAVNGLREMIQNIGATDMIRTEFLRFLLDGPRDIDGECGYPLVLTPDHYRAMYDREGIARRVVHCEPEESWQMDPEVYEDEDPENDTEFEKAWKDNCKKWNFYQFLQRIDILSGIGQYGVLLLGIDDGKELYEPVEGFNDDGTIDEGNDYNLLYLRVFDETVIWTKVRETDINNPRYGLPKLYTIQFRDFPNWGIQAGEIIARDVHWSRVIHVADNRKMSEVYGQPRMQEVYNRLYDLRKIYSADGEAFWKNGFAALAFEMSPEVADQGIPIDKEGMKQQMERFQNGTQRYIALEGMTVKTLPPAVVDPTPHTKVHLTAIATSKAIPYRILFGSEEAKLAGEQDSRAWNKRVARRQSLYVTPMLLRPFVDRMIAYGVLPKPKVEYFVDWPDLNTPTDQDKATVSLTKTQAMAAYIQSGLSQLMSPRDYYVTILGMSVEEADSLLDNAADFNGSEGDQNDDSQFDEDQPQFPKDQEEDESNEGGLGGANPDNGSNLEQKNLSRRTTVGRGQAVDAQLVQQPSLNVEAGKPNHPFDVTVQKLVNNVNAGIVPYLGKPDTNNLLLTAAVYKRELERLPKKIQCFVDNAVFGTINQEFESVGILLMPDAVTINEWSKEAEEARWAGHIKAEPGVSGGTAVAVKTKVPKAVWNGHSMVGLIRHSAVKGLTKEETSHLLEHGMGMKPSKHTIYIQHKAALAGGKVPELSEEHKAKFNELVQKHLGKMVESPPVKKADPTPSASLPAVPPVVPAAELHTPKLAPKVRTPKTEPKQGLPELKDLKDSGTVLGGSTGAKLMVDSTGQKYVVKYGKNSDHLKNEVDADSAYKVMGGVTQESKLTKDSEGKDVKIAKYVEGKSLGEIKTSNPKLYEQAKLEIKKHFVMDALLANWDVVGMKHDNIVVSQHEGGGVQVHRIDNGGALRYRAQGGLKGDKFGNSVGEVLSLRNSITNPSSASVFANITDEEIKQQAKDILGKKDSILGAISDAGARQTVKARIDWLNDNVIHVKPQKGLGEPGNIVSGHSLYKNPLPAEAPPIDHVPAHDKKWDKMREKTQANWEKNLTMDERTAIQSWTSSAIGIRKTDMINQPSEKALAIRSAMRKAPRQIAPTLKRNITGVDQKAIMSTPPGVIIQMECINGFSTRDDLGIGQSKHDGATLVIQNSTRGTALGSIGYHKEEKEVLVDKGSKYAVTKVVMEKGWPHIYLTEVD
jgi:uncharacterized protein